MPRTNPALVDWLTRPSGLATRLKAARVAAGLNGSQFARALDWQQSKVSRIETGATVPSADDVTAWAKAARIPAAERRKLLGLQGDAAVERLRLRGQTDQEQHQQSFADLHRQATAIIEYSTSVLPGPVQLEPYAEAVLQAWGRLHNFNAVTLTQAATIRAARAALLREPGRTHRFLMAEPILHWNYGGQAIMTAQLDWLTTIAELPGVDLRVIPQAAAIEVPIGHGFVAFDDLVITETWTSTDYGSWRDYEPVVNLLESAALGTEDSLDLVQQAANRSSQQL